jgi:TonB-linked SusC/RagA family outer membrane protein
MNKKFWFKKNTCKTNWFFQVLLRSGMVFFGIILSVSLAFGQIRTISGTVMDVSGNPLPGVNITVSGTTSGTISDAEGRFTIQADPDATLVLSFVGMETLEVELGNRTSLDVTMQEAQLGLDEVIVIGYGTQSRSTVTTAITKVDADKIEQVPETSVAKALQGKLAGVRIYADQGGQPGSDAAVLIRGGSSINKSNDPLVIVDGMVRSLNDINPNDIETVQVLKDASSTAIYGARASNGVMLITTKKGRLGKAEINFDMNTGFASPWKYMDILGAEDYLRMVREAANRSPFAKDLDAKYPWATGNSASSPFSTRYLEEGEEIPEGYQSMVDPVDPTKTLVFQENDFQRLTLRTALEQNYNLSANGGTDRIKYAASIGYSDIAGTSVGTYYNRFNGRSNVDFALRKNLVLSTRMDHSSSSTNSYPDQRHIFARSVWIAPTTKVYLDDGTFASGQNRTYSNPLWYNDVNQRTIQVYRSGVSANLAWDIIPGLKLEGSADYFIRNRTFESFEKANVFRSNRGAVFQYAQTKNFQYEGVATFKRTFNGLHNINSVAGISLLTEEDFNSRAEVEGASTDLIMTLNSGPTKLDATTSRSDEALLGVFGRVLYDYSGKYLLGVSLRRDASSRFAAENRVGYFPGASAGWVISEEDFMGDVSAINTLKFRASWGQTGNNSVGKYAYAGEYAVGNNYFGMAGTFPTEMPNYGLRWETTTQWNVGFDLGLFGGDRVRLLVDYYDKVTSDLLFNVPLPNESGFNNIDQNIGKVKFYGTEVELRADIVNKSRFRWTSDFNFGYTMNRVLELPDNGIPQNRIGGTYDPNTGFGIGGIAEGERMYSTTGVLFEGILDTWEEANNANFDTNASGWSPEDGKKVKGRKIPGDREWVDQNGDGVIDAYDRVVLGYLVPTVTGGFGNRLILGSFTFNVFMDYTLGHSIADATLRRSYGNVISGAYTPLSEVLTDSWTQEGDAAAGKTLPRFDILDQKQQRNYNRDSDLSVYKGDYLCLRELRLSYNAPATITSKLKLNSLRISLSAQNVWYFTSYPGWTTEYSSNANYQDNNYPIPRKIMLGLKIGF